MQNATFETCLSFMQNKNANTFILLLTKKHLKMIATPATMRSICLHFSVYVYIYEHLHEV